LSRIIKSPRISDASFPVNESATEDRGQPALSAEERLARANRKAEETLASARAEAERMRSAAVAELDALRQNARQEAERLQQAARTQGLEEGREQGRREVREALRAQAQAFEELVAGLTASIQREKQKLIEAFEPQLIRLACAIAGRLVRRELEQDRETVGRIAAQAISLANEKEKMNLRLNPEDLHEVRQQSDRLKALHEEIKELILEEDPRIERGGCIIETVVGNVDARIERQLAELGRELLDSV
jgi:flagellar assembly protein FliH